MLLWFCWFHLLDDLIPTHLVYIPLRSQLSVRLLFVIVNAADAYYLLYTAVLHIHALCLRGSIPVVRLANLPLSQYLAQCLAQCLSDVARSAKPIS